MPPLQRFDQGQSAPLSDEELNRRWAGFHRAVHSSSPNPLRRLIGPLLGENTARDRVLRLLLTPWLARRRRGDVTATTLEDQAAPFPSNFEPGAESSKSHHHDHHVRRDVLVVVVNEEGSSLGALVDSLNESLRASECTWLLLVDVATGADERDIALDCLRDAANADVDVVFADEFGPIPSTPILKPAAVGPHTLISYNLVGRPALIKVATLRNLGGFNADVGWSFEHDAYLRIEESGGRFLHVAEVLAAGRPEIAFRGEHIDDATVAATRASLARRGWKGTVQRGPVAGVSQWTMDTPSPTPSIDIVIPTRDRIDLVRRCIQSIERSTYPNYDIIIIDNDSAEPESKEFFRTTRYRVVKSPGAFNYAKIVNEGVAHSNADFVVTLNNDTFVLTADWLERMVGLASLDDVGVVGVTLLDRAGDHEHDGFVIAPYPQHLRLGSNYPAVDQYGGAIRDVIAVTGAAQMVRRSFWQHLGGMDERLRVVMNDVDLCLRSQLEGRHAVFNPYVEIIHYAGSSRGDLDPIEDRNLFIDRWDVFGTFQDPYVPESLEMIGGRFFYRDQLDRRRRSPKVPRR